MTQARRQTVVAWAGTALLIGLCLWPRGLLPAREGGPGTIPHVDKVIHFGMFAGFSLLWMNARPPRPRGRAWGLAVLAAALMLAVGTEVAQGLPAVNRDPDPLDGLADAFGAFVAVGAISATARKPPDDPLAADDPEDEQGE